VIASRGAVVIAGAGVAAAASRGKPVATWRGLLEDGIERCRELGRANDRWVVVQRENLELDDLECWLSVAEQVTKKLGGQEDGEFKGWLRSSVGGLQLDPQARGVIDALVGLGIPVATTNYDNLIEDASELGAATWLDTSRALRILRREERGVVHLHGHWEKSESVVLGVSSYRDVLDNKAAQAMLQAMTAFSSFVLVGFGAGLEDPNFGALREWMAATWFGAEHRHYRLVRADELEAITATHRTEERIAPVVYGETHADLEPFLRSLAPASPDGRGARVAAVRGAASATRVRFNLPLPLKEFVGREDELRSLDAILNVDSDELVIHVISGMGGAGKTQLASRFAHRHAERYDVVAWIRAEDGAINDLSTLAGRLGGMELEGLSLEQRAERALDWLTHCDESWLLIIDNLESTDALASCCPPYGNGRVIVTSRDRDLIQFGSELKLRPFDEALAVDYLVTRTRRDAERGDALRVAKALGGLPLALSHAGALCAAGVSFNDYLELLPDSDDPEDPIASTWRVSIDKAERMAPLSAEILAMAAWLAPDDIPRALLGVLLDGATDASSRRRLARSVQALERFSLARVDDTTISVHRLIQRTVREQALLERDASGALYALSALDEAFPTDFGHEWWQACEELLPHVLALTQLFEDDARVARVAEVVEEPAELWAGVVGLLNRAAYYLLKAETSQRAAGPVDAALTLSARLLDPRHSEALRARSNLGFLHWRAGESDKAIEVEQQVAADCRDVFGAGHERTFHAQICLAESLQSAGHTDQALELKIPLLPACEQALGPDHPYTLDAISLLAVSREAAGEHEEAIRLGERVVAARERVLGVGHADTLASRANLVKAYAAGGMPDKALELAERTVADCEAELGPLHPKTLVARHSGAIALHASGRPADAVRLGTSVLADLERILGPAHPETRSCTVDMCIWQVQRDMAQRAEGLYLRVASLADAAALAAIKREVEDATYASLGTAEEHAQGLAEFCSPEYLRGLIADEQTTVLMAEFLGEPVALCAITRDPDGPPKLHAVYSRLRGRQVGLHLVSSAAKLIVAERHEEIRCEIFEGNMGARKYFEALGFREAGSRPSDTYHSQQLVQYEAMPISVEAAAHALLHPEEAQATG
jgi:hypothetical protein